jgi:hypothetical protein
MSTFVEVFSIEKNCKTIINLDEVLEIVPLRDGGTALFFADSAAVGGKTSYKVTDSYSLFQQFALQPVSADAIANKVRSLKSPVVN